MIRTLFFLGLALGFSVLAAATAHHFFAAAVSAVAQIGGGL